jgi:hypothetical protein
MSRFTRRRKAIRLKQEEDRKRWEENSKAFDKGCKAIINTCRFIRKKHKEFDSLDGDSRIRLFGKVLDKIHNSL